MSNLQTVFERYPSSVNSYAFVRFNIIDNGDNTVSIYVEDRPNSDASSTSAGILPTGKQVVGGGAGGGVTGSGMTNQVPKWTDGPGGVLGDSSISDTGLVITITNPSLVLVGTTITFPDGVRQTFNPNATTPGFNVGSISNDPSAPSNGDLWYDSTSNLLRARVNGASLSLGAAVPGGISGDIQYNNAGAFDGSLLKQSANTITQQNGVTPQTQLIAGTFTSSTNLEALSLSYDSDNARFVITSVKGSGGGSARDVVLKAAFPQNVSFGVNDGSLWVVQASNHLLPQSNNAQDFGSVVFHIRSGYFGTSLVLGAASDAGIIPVAAKVVGASDGATPNAGWFTDAGVKRVSSQFDNNTTTLADVTGLSVNVQAGRTYSFQATLFTTSNVGGGVKVAIGGTVTATAIVYEGLSTNAGATTQGRATALGSAVGGVTAVTGALITIYGTITVNAAGTLTVQFAENAAIGTSSVLVGSSFIVEDNP